MQNINKLKKLAGAARLSAEDKAFISGLAAEMGVEFVHRANCKSCYQDKAVELYKLLTENEPKDTSAKHQLRAGVDVCWCGYRINCATMSDDFAEMLLAKGFPASYFVCK